MHAVVVTEGRADIEKLKGSFLGSFTKLEEGLLVLSCLFVCPSIRPSVCMKQLGSH